MRQDGLNVSRLHQRLGRRLPAALNQRLHVRGPAAAAHVYYAPARSLEQGQEGAAHTHGAAQVGVQHSCCGGSVHKSSQANASIVHYCIQVRLPAQHRPHCLCRCRHRGIAGDIKLHYVRAGCCVAGQRKRCHCFMSTLKRAAAQENAAAMVSQQLARQCSANARGRASYENAERSHCRKGNAKNAKKNQKTLQKVGEGLKDNKHKSQIKYQSKGLHFPSKKISSHSESMMCKELPYFFEQ